MKATFLLTVAAAFFLAAVTPGRAAEQPLAVAIFDFHAADGKLAGKGPEVALLLGAKLSTAPNIILVERQELEKALGEQELGLSGTVSPESAAKVGALTGAKVLITGRVFDAGAKNYVVLKIIGTETSRVFSEAETFNDPATLDKAIAELAPRVIAIIGKQAAALVAKVEEPAQRLTRLRESIAGRKLPSVTVSVAERHLTRAIIDPAVETELKATLQQLGFEVIDPKASAKVAEVAITGEAFSEAAGRRANLISCRARVELKAVRGADGKTLLTDRQTDVAVDLAENIAGKSALENAARKLLDRLVPKLAEP